MTTESYYTPISQADRDLLEKIAEEVIVGPPVAMPDARAYDGQKAAAWAMAHLKATEAPDGVGYLRGSTRFQIVWLGLDKTGAPRKHGNLIVNPDEQERHGDNYIVVSGTAETGFALVGWAKHSDLVKREPRDFGAGPRWAVPTSVLRVFKDAVA